MRLPRAGSATLVAAIFDLKGLCLKIFMLTKQTGKLNSAHMLET
jgi:hypothetical protein